MKPKIICYCGSMRYWDEFIEMEMKSLEDGTVPLLPCCMAVDIERVYGSESDFKVKADADHKRKIDIADEVFIINKDGYIGESTRSEIEYALKIGKPVKYMEEVQSDTENI